MVVNFIIQYFKGVKPRIQSDKQVFVFVVGDRMLKQSIVKSKPDIGFGNSILKSGRVTFNSELAPLSHILILSYYSLTVKCAPTPGAAVISLVKAGIVFSYRMGLAAYPGKARFNK